ncbi:MAG TPA: LLM class flavin-dependent oxidoreductase [Acidimicrobiales bacterium]|nr:LLM class flavin-dependent oxidoreductase [Acidimicrobiales bacterium]
MSATDVHRPAFGFAVGYDPRATVADMTAQVAEAERAGFALGMFSEAFFTNRDSVSALASFAAATSAMGLATTQIVRLRSPLLMAQTAATLDELSGGRLTLVLGAATARHGARNGLPAQVPPATPPQTLREYLQAVRLLLTGERVTFRGDVVRLDDVGLNWRPVRQGVPLWTAATSRLGLRIAAELADGVLLDGGASPEYTASALALLRRHRAAAGKSMDGFTVAQLISVSVADDEQQALDAVRWEVASKFRYSLTALSKIAVGEPHVDRDAPDRLSALYREHGERALLEAIPDPLVRALTASGDEEQVRARVEAYRSAGVELPVLRVPNNAQAPRLFELAARSGWVERPVAGAR